MKSSRFMVSATFALFVLLTSAFAQTGAIRVTVPFDFTRETDIGSGRLQKYEFSSRPP